MKVFFFYGGIVRVVSVTAFIRVAVEISGGGGNCGFCSGSGGIDICWVVIVLVVMIRGSSGGGGDDDRCCNANGGSCD